jgi:hypothetical protein
MAKRSLTLILLIIVLLMAASLPAQAAGFSTTLSFPEGVSSYYTLTITLTAGVPFRAQLDCALESDDYDSPGSIDPYLELYDADGIYITYADDEGDQDCAGYNNAILEYTPTMSGIYRLEAWDISENGGDGILTLSGISGAGLAFPDGRVNQEQWATAAIFCVVNGNLDVYAIDAAGVGTLVIREDWKALEALGIPEVNTLRAQSEDGNIRVYRLSSGEWQLNAPADGLFDGYVFRWTECTPGGSGGGQVSITGPTIDGDDDDSPPDDFPIDDDD